jgi:1-pyrroline-5-carboxylate dehydrogenase
MLGNVILWKPSPMAMLSSHVFLEILHEAGLPKGVIQFIPGPPEPICSTCFAHPLFAGLHYTGSTAVFKTLWKNIVSNIDTLQSYPRIV